MVDTGSPGRTHWSRSGRDPCNLEHVASAQSFFPGGSGSNGLPVFIHQYEKPYFVYFYVPMKCRHLLPCRECRTYVRTGTIFLRLNTILPTTLQPCRPEAAAAAAAAAGSHLRVWQAHMRVGLRCTAMARYLSLRSIVPQQHTTSLCE